MQRIGRWWGWWVIGMFLAPPLFWAAMAWLWPATAPPPAVAAVTVTTGERKGNKVEPVEVEAPAPPVTPAPVLAYANCERFLYPVEIPKRAHLFDDRAERELVKANRRAVAAIKCLREERARAAKGD